MEKSVPILRFYKQAHADKRLYPTHLSMYLALYKMWLTSGCQNEFAISRRELMPLAKIRSTATYHKCIRELSEFQYVSYRPNYDYYCGSLVSLVAIGHIGFGELGS